MKRVVFYSSGAGSWAAARRLADAHGTDDIYLVFTDVKGNNPSPHAGEDEDNYRFLVESAADIFGVDISAAVRFGADWRTLADSLLPRLIWLNEGRDIWQVFRDDRFLGNSRLANCSKFLKQRPARAWLDANCDPSDTVVYVGIDWTETHRLPAIKQAYLPYRAEAPMTGEPHIDKDEMLASLTARGIKPPRLYELSFAHANCGGFCVRAGQGHMLNLLEKMPDRYSYHEEHEEELRQYLGKDVAILRLFKRAEIMERLGLTDDDLEARETFLRYDDEGNERTRKQWFIKATGEPLPRSVPITLRDFRKRVENKCEVDRDDIGGCGCFVEEESA